MTEQHDKHVKILIRFYSNLLNKWIVETLWAEIVDSSKGYYKINNIPFYASIASDDIVFAEYDASEKMLTYRETIQFSGNSLVQVVIMDKQVEANEIRERFNALGCQSEKLNEGYFVLEIPAYKDYRPLKDMLNDLYNNGTIDYAEPVLSDKHNLFE